MDADALVDTVKETDSLYVKSMDELVMDDSVLDAEMLGEKPSDCGMPLCPIAERKVCNVFSLQ